MSIEMELHRRSEDKQVWKGLGRIGST